jgi:hypothetical protein
MGGTKCNILCDDQGLTKEWFFQLNNALVPTTDIIRMWTVADKIQLLQHPSYLLDLAPADYFLFWMLKGELDGLTLESIKKFWEGVLQNISIDECRHCLHAVVGLLQQVLMASTFIYIYLYTIVYVFGRVHNHTSQFFLPTSFCM